MIMITIYRLLSRFVNLYSITLYQCLQLIASIIIGMTYYILCQLLVGIVSDNFQLDLL